MFLSLLGRPRVNRNTWGKKVGNGSRDAHHSMGGGATQHPVCPHSGADVTEVSNISSPDYQDDENLISTKDMWYVLEKRNCVEHNTP